MKINFNKIIWVMLAIVTLTSFGACSDDDDTQSSVLLEAFGPSPALRGGELTFIGRNLNRVTSVILPDNIEITTIEVVSNEKIKITIPQNATEGYVIVKAGNIEITSKSLLSYTEPVSIESLSPSPVKPGEIVSIEGDYLNLMTRVLFTDEVEVTSDDFISWDRYKIEVRVPLKAQTGVITLMNDDAIPLELKSEIELQVILPSVTQIVEASGRKPGDKLSVTGANLDLVESVILPDGETVEFTVESNTLSLILPEDASNGVIEMVAYSGVAVPIIHLTMAGPDNLVATPTEGIRANDVITITGTNLELVTTVSFPGAEEEVTPTTQSATTITVTVPAGTTSGELVLNTASGNTATIEIVTLKPTVSGFNPSPVSAGSEVILTGTNLDLVAAVTFGGGKTVEEFTTDPATSLTVKVPVDAESGELTLTMQNGETVGTESLEITKPIFGYIPTLPTGDIIAGTILTVDIQNEDKLENVQVNGSGTQYILQGSSLNILMPAGVTGNVELTLISSNGEVTYDLYVIASGIVETVIFTGPLEVTWGDGGRVFLPTSDFENLSPGAVMKLYFTQTDNWGQVQINNGWWSAIPFTELNNDGYLSTDILGDKSITEFELILTQEVLDNIMAAAGDDAIIMQGSDFIIDQVSIITGR